MSRRHQLSMESYDRLFPNQDTLPPRRLRQDQRCRAGIAPQRGDDEHDARSLAHAVPVDRVDRHRLSARGAGAGVQHQIDPPGRSFDYVSEAGVAVRLPAVGKDLRTLLPRAIFLGAALFADDPFGSFFADNAFGALLADNAFGGVTLRCRADRAGGRKIGQRRPRWNCGSRDILAPAREIRGALRGQRDGRHRRGHDTQPEFHYASPSTVPRRRTGRRFRRRLCRGSYGWMRRETTGKCR